MLCPKEAREDPGEKSSSVKACSWHPPSSVIGELPSFELGERFTWPDAWKGLSPTSSCCTLGGRWRSVFWPASFWTSLALAWGVKVT